MTAKIIDGRRIAGDLRKNIAKEIEVLKSKYGKSPNITTIKIGDNPESNIYLKLRDKACGDAGIVSSHLTFPGNVSQETVIESIVRLNENKNVHGALIQLPMPGHLSFDEMINILDPKKDVEGLTPYNMGLTFLGSEKIVPCTPLAVLKILEDEKVSIQGKNVVIVNHSTIVGRPLAGLFLNRNATTAVTHVFTKDLAEHTSKADILVSAAGVPNLIKADHVKDDAFVIDVGIVKTSNGICGDVDFDSVKEKAGKITPVPGGVGPVTVACSVGNMVKTFKGCLDEK